MIRSLITLGLVVYFMGGAVLGDTIYSKLMTPKWLYENAYFKPSAVKSHDLKRLILHQPLESTGRLLTVPLPSVRTIQEDVVFKITVSAKNPMGDSDLRVGIGNARGFYAAAYIIDNRPYGHPLLLSNSPFKKVTGADVQESKNGTGVDVQGSTVLTKPFDEQITFLYKPSERFGAYYSGGQVVTGIFSDGPDMSKDIYLVVSGDGNPLPKGENYAIQYITVEIMSA
jgi:hypothetical protein